HIQNIVVGTQVDVVVTRGFGLVGTVNHNFVFARARIDYRTTVAEIRSGEIIDIAFNAKVVITSAERNIMLAVTFDIEPVVASLEVNHIVAVALNEDAVNADGTENSQGGIGINTTNKIITLALQIQPQVCVKGACVN